MSVTSQKPGIFRVTTWQHEMDQGKDAIPGGGGGGGGEVRIWGW